MKQTPVFLDHLPDISSVTGWKPEQYRLKRNKALSDLLLDPTAEWEERLECPGCSEPVGSSRSFSRSFLPFQRCSECNTIFASRMPNQAALDRLRLELLTDATSEDEHGRDSEFISLLNWVSLTEARVGPRVDTVLDYRFGATAPGFEKVTAQLSHSRDWMFVPLEVEDDHTLLRDALRTHRPKALLIQAEMDRTRDPKHLLRLIKENATERMLVFVGTSCADGLEYEILGADSPSFIPLDRLNLFSVKGFERLADSVGFEVLEVSTPGRRDAVLLQHFFSEFKKVEMPFWSSFFREANRDRLRDLQILLQRCLKSSVMRFVLQA